MIDIDLKFKVQAWIEREFETRKFNASTNMLDYYTPHYRVIDDPARPLIVDFMDPFITCIDHREDAYEYPIFQVPFVARGISEIQILNRTIRHWNDVPIAEQTVYVDRCKIPPLNDIPSRPGSRWWIGIDVDREENIIPIFDRADLNLTIRIVNSVRSIHIAITKEYDGPIHVDMIKARRETMNDAFELQNWLIDNELEKLV